VTFFEETFFYFLFYLFIFWVTNNGILTCGISLDSEKLSLSKSEYKNIFVPSYLKKVDFHLTLNYFLKEN
jgi:hypothetical protein